MIYHPTMSFECPNCGELKQNEEDMCSYCGYKRKKSYKRDENGKIVSRRYVAKLSESKAVFAFHIGNVKVELSETINTAERFNGLRSLMSLQNARTLYDIFPEAYRVASNWMNENGELPTFDIAIRFKDEEGDVVNVRDTENEETFLSYVHEGKDSYAIDALQWTISISGGYGLVKTKDEYGRCETHVFAEEQNIEELKELAEDKNVVFMTGLVNGHIQTFKYPGSIYKE